MDLRTKAAQIRSLIQTGGFSTSEVAALVETSPRVVRAVRQRMKTPDRLHYLEMRVQALETAMRALLGSSTRKRGE